MSHHGRPWTAMELAGSCENLQVSASKKYLTLAALTCNWQLKLNVPWLMDDQKSQKIDFQVVKK